MQNLLGTLSDAHSQMARMSTTDANKMSVRTELQADFYAGIWAYHDNEMFGSLEPGDIEEGLNAASKIETTICKSRHKDTPCRKRLITALPHNA